MWWRFMKSSRTEEANVSLHQAAASRRLPITSDTVSGPQPQLAPLVYMDGAIPAVFDALGHCGYNRGLPG